MALIYSTHLWGGRRVFILKIRNELVTVNKLPERNPVGESLFPDGCRLDDTRVPQLGHHVILVKHVRFVLSVGAYASYEVWLAPNHLHQVIIDIF